MNCGIVFWIYSDIKLFMKKIIATSFVVILILAASFALIFFAAKNIIPNIVGNTVINNEISTSTLNQKLIGNKAPFFDLSDLSGNRVRLDSFLNYPVILVFWATWNQSSTDQIKIIDDYLSNNNVHSNLIKIIAIDSLEDISVAKSFIKRGDYTVNVALDTTGGISNAYDIKSLPTTYFIDRDGIVREIYTGILSENAIVVKVESILK